MQIEIKFTTGDTTIIVEKESNDTYISYEDPRIALANSYPLIDEAVAALKRAVGMETEDV
jgi:hypothetical protein